MMRWARERAGYSVPELTGRFPRLAEWERGALQPTLKQVERFAQATHAPVGYLFLPEPPVERLPIPDFRTMAGAGVRQPSPNLLDMLYACQQRQEWYRDYARTVGETPLRFVGSARVGDDVVTAAGRMRTALGFDLDVRRQLPTWTDALRQFIEQAEALGVLVMVSGVVLNNTHRKLDPDEFRGFALSDDIAPLVFINGADTKSAQMFTLAHELAHLWLAQSAVSDAQPALVPEHDVERWCNRVAAELLVPLAAVQQQYRRDVDLWEEVTRLARYFKVSTLVVLRRIHDAGGLGGAQFWAAYQAEVERLRALTRRGGGGGDFYATETARLGKRFVRALVSDTLEGQTLHRDAFRMLGITRLETFHELGRRLGVQP